MTLIDNVYNLFFKDSGLLFDEPENLLRHELREPTGYNAIITSIANGANKLSEIASKTKITTSLCDSYLTKLIDIGLVKKEISILEKNKKKGIYVLSEILFKFWFCYVQNTKNLIL